MKNIKPLLRDNTQNQAVDDDATEGLYQILLNTGLCKLVLELVELQKHDKYDFSEAFIATGNYKDLFPRSKVQIYLLVPLDALNIADYYAEMYILSAFLTFYGATHNNKKLRSISKVLSTIFLGYTMMFAADTLYKILKMVNYPFIRMFKYCESLTRFRYKGMRKWGVKRIKRIGKQFYLKGCRHLQMIQDQVPPQIEYIQGQYESCIMKNYDKAKTHYVISIVGEVTLVHRIVALFALGLNCMRNGEYLIGKRSVNAAFRLSGAQLMNTLKVYIIQELNSKYVVRMNKSKCVNCGKTTIENGAQLKSCKLCMNTFYCGKRCQKKHWKRHKYECNKTWRSLYPAMKMTIFDPLYNQSS